MVSRNRKDGPNLDLQGISLNGATAPLRLSRDGEHGGSPSVSNPGRDGAADKHEAAAADAAGKIEVSPKAISHLASRAAQRSYGVVGLASKHARPGWAELLRREELSKGVEVSFHDGSVLVNLYVVIEYGTRISEVARNIMSNVKFALESSLGVEVVQVNVTVQGIRVSK
jgi:uncharacterized alkaline shock family protein YloU